MKTNSARLAVTPFGNSQAEAAVVSRRDILRIAQRFNAGYRGIQRRVPKGRLNSRHNNFQSAVPSGLIQLTMGLPALKRRAIFKHPSGMLPAARLRSAFGNSRKALGLAALSVALLLPGCILPGGLQVVGRYDVHGRLLSANGQGLEGKNVVVLQPHAGSTDRKMVRALADGSESDAPDWPAIVLTTNARGKFDHQFRGFTHCHPFWVFPPLFELPCHLSGATRHGRFFLLKTPDAEGRIYEVEVRQPTPRVRVVDPASARLRSLKVGDEVVAGITVQTQRMTGPFGWQAHTKTPTVVRLEITRPRSRE